MPPNSVVLMWIAIFKATGKCGKAFISLNNIAYDGPMGDPWLHRRNDRNPRIASESDTDLQEGGAPPRADGMMCFLHSICVRQRVPI